MLETALAEQGQTAEAEQGEGHGFGDRHGPAETAAADMAAVEHLGETVVARSTSTLKRKLEVERG